MFRLMSVFATLSLAATVQAGFLIEIDTDGMDDGVLTFNPSFSFGGDTSTASQSATTTAFGTTGGDSIFGGDGTLQPDTYVYVYNPPIHGDNLDMPQGTHLGEGNFATGIEGGGVGMYRVYALWPFTNNVSGGLTTYDVVAPGDNFIITLDQNDRGGEWALLGTINYTGGVITVRQSSTTNAFVSMRAYGVLFERVVAPCAGDLNSDGVTDGQDLALMLAVWGTNNALADLNNDGIVDGADLAALLGTWGFCV